MGEGASFNPEQRSTKKDETESWPSIADISFDAKKDDAKPEEVDNSVSLYDLRPGDPIPVSGPGPSPYIPGIPWGSSEEPSPYRVPDNPKSREKLGPPRSEENDAEPGGPSV